MTIKKELLWMFLISIIILYITSILIVQENLYPKKHSWFDIMFRAYGDKKCIENHLGNIKINLKDKTIEFFLNVYPICDDYKYTEFYFSVSNSTNYYTYIINKTTGYHYYKKIDEFDYSFNESTHSLLINFTNDTYNTNVESKSFIVGFYVDEPLSLLYDIHTEHIKSRYTLIFTYDAGLFGLECEGDCYMVYEGKSDRELSPLYTYNRYKHYLEAYKRITNVNDGRYLFRFNPKSKKVMFFEKISDLILLGLFVVVVYQLFEEHFKKKKKDNKDVVV